MASGFVSGGTNDQPIQRDDDWLRAQQEIEASRRRKEEEGRQEGGKSLYEVLQQNKTAKQEAFEESIRLKNQFRSLDDDEVEFLDSVLESTRAKEAAVRKETSEQLEIFRKQREEAEKALLDATEKAPRGANDATSFPDNDSWSISTKKRRRVKEADSAAGYKLRKTSSSVDESLTERQPVLASAAANEEKPSATPITPVHSAKPSADLPESKQPSGKMEAKIQTKIVASTTNLGLGAYSSDDE